MLKRWKKRSALRIKRTYDKVEFPDNYLIKQDKQINKIFEHIKSNPDIYKRNKAREDNLNGIPDVIIKEEQGFVPNELDVPIKATICYTFTTKISSKKPKRLLPAIFIFLAAILVFNIFIFSDIAKAEKINKICKIYYKHGKPTHIDIGNNREFNLNNLTYEDFIFLNPWNKQMMDNTKISDCIQINTGEDNE